MVENLLALESELVAAVFLLSLSTLLLWEKFWPRRTGDDALGARWKVNFGMFFTGMALRLLVRPLTALAVAILAGEREIGLLNLFEAPLLVACVVGVLAMDLANYLQHVLMHKLPLLWRIHRVHHADSACDVTTSLRFHPLELFVGTAVDLCAVAIFGVPAIAVLVYRLGRGFLSATAHGNVALPIAVDAVIRKVFVTPDVHRIHHSQRVSEQNSNFSGGLLCWDYLFGTYLAESADSQRDMALGLREYQVEHSASFWRMLWEPFTLKQRR